MNKQIDEILCKYSPEIINLYNNLRQIIFSSTTTPPEELLWARLPSYYSGESFVRLIPFKDHINIEAKAITDHIEDLSTYKITPKGMLQIFVGQDLPTKLLEKIFNETLG